MIDLPGVCLEQGRMRSMSGDRFELIVRTGFPSSMRSGFRVPAEANDADANGGTLEDPGLVSPCHEDAAGVEDARQVHCGFATADAVRGQRPARLPLRGDLGTRLLEPIADKSASRGRRPVNMEPAST